MGLRSCKVVGVGGDETHVHTLVVLHLPGEASLSTLTWRGFEVECRAMRLKLRSSSATADARERQIQCVDRWEELRRV